MAHAYPRPQLVRTDWHSLNGLWDFALDTDGRWALPEQVSWSATIRVPFAPETEASGVADTGFHRAYWYRCTIPAPALAQGERLILHFGAVDFHATVWANGQLAATHEGGYTPFSADITGHLHGSGELTVVVRAEDDPHDMAKPRGKQDWQLEPHSIWYPRTSGIWQTVWYERVPATSVGALRWTPDVERWEIGLEARLDGAPVRGARLRVRLSEGGRLLADDTYLVDGGALQRRIAFADPGVDSAREELMWSPDRPTLIDAEVDLLDADGTLLDRVQSYTAMRQVALLGGRLLLNGQICRLRLVLDQGYWPASGLTPPSDSALRRDVELVKAMGFNGVRKHQKIEDPRFLYWADRLGLLVWEEMPSAYSFSPSAAQRLSREWTAAIERDYSHPCIIAWVPINESWGVPNLPSRADQRHHIAALYHLTRALDPTRPVVGNDGWEHGPTDIVGIHDYASDPAKLARRYGDPEDAGRLFAHERPGGRVLLLEGHGYAGQPIMLTEFGGIALSDNRAATWGYTRSESAGEFAAQYHRLLDTVWSCRALAGFCYTQLTDTYQEANGLLYADRTPKVPLALIAAATTNQPMPQLQELQPAVRDSGVEI